MIKVAYGSVPKDGGTFTFYRNIRPALLDRGIDMRCVAVGQAQASLWEDAYADEGCVLLAPSSFRVKRQSQAFVAWCEENEIDIVIGVNSEAILSAIPHLPSHIRAVARCANAFDHGYRITMSGGDRLQAIIATTPRLRDDLVSAYDAPANKIALIPNGIDPAPFDREARPTSGLDRTLRIAFLGRLEHKQKGVLHLPNIVDALDRRDINYQLRIAGKGAHGALLQDRMKAQIQGGRVEFVGSLSPKQVPAFLNTADVFLFPSHFEGCPNALLEALVSGCVPVAWQIDGITNYLIHDGDTGFVCPMGDAEMAAERISQFASDPALLQRFSDAARNDARARFSVAAAAEAYSSVFQKVMQAPETDRDPLPWSDFEVDPNFPQSWRSWIPAPVKFAMKGLATRLRGDQSGLPTP